MHGSGLVDNSRGSFEECVDTATEGSAGIYDFPIVDFQLDVNRCVTREIEPNPEESERLSQIVAQAIRLSKEERHLLLCQWASCRQRRDVCSNVPPLETAQTH